MHVTQAEDADNIEIVDCEKPPERPTKLNNLNMTASLKRSNEEYARLRKTRLNAGNRRTNIVWVESFEK